MYQNKLGSSNAQSHLNCAFEDPFSFCVYTWSTNDLFRNRFWVVMFNVSLCLSLALSLSLSLYIYICFIYIYMYICIYMCCVPHNLTSILQSVSKGCLHIRFKFRACVSRVEDWLLWGRFEADNFDSFSHAVSQYWLRSSRRQLENYHSKYHMVSRVTAITLWDRWSK